MKVSIVEQYQPRCQGKHVDPEYMLVDGRWQRTDRDHSTPVVETLTQGADETAGEFMARLSQRADEIDRELSCSRCYR